VAPRVSIVTTTIFPPAFLRSYSENLAAFGRTEQVSIFIAGDRRVPPEMQTDVERARSEGIDVRFLTLDDQARLLRPFPDLAAIIPENSDNRRNAGFVAALLDGADVVISIDDDNFCREGEDFVAAHLAVGNELEHREARGANGWYNLCSLLEAAPAPELLYPRGFPYRRRSPGSGSLGSPTSGRVGVNVGLWLLDPDTDAIGRLLASPVVSGWSGESVLLGPGVRCPINTQNTALSRDAMGAYYYVRMGAQLKGLTLDRFGDILSGYFLQVCADAVGDRIRIGSPVLEHRRNPHDLLVDLYHELAGVMMLEDLSEFFSSVQLPGGSYLEAYRAASDELERFVSSQKGFVWTDETKEYLRNVARWMRIWADVVAAIG
jgi:hypothetical protein